MSNLVGFKNKLCQHLTGKKHKKNTNGEWPGKTLRCSVWNRNRHTLCDWLTDFRAHSALHNLMNATTNRDSVNSILYSSHIETFYKTFKTFPPLQIAELLILLPMATETDSNIRQKHYNNKLNILPNHELVNVTFAGNFESESNVCMRHMFYGTVRQRYTLAPQCSLS